MTGPATFLGLPVFPGAHNMRDQLVESQEHAGAWVGDAPGRRTWDDYVGLPVPTRRLTWTCFDRASSFAARTWLLSLQGRLAPFWLPTFARDLRVIDSGVYVVGPPPETFHASWPDAALPGQWLLVSGEAQYRTKVWSSRRQYLAGFVPGAPVWGAATVTAVADNLDGNDLLHLDSWLSGPSLFVQAGPTATVCHLVLVRSASDDVTLHWANPECAEIRLETVEPPLEPLT